jgi:DNA-directed RNA polymerase specialized sigma24 family protein
VEVRDLLTRLRPDHRIALELKYMIGLDGEEAAAAMSRSHGAFRSLLHRATLAFRAESASLSPLDSRAAAAVRA